MYLLYLHIIVSILQYLHDFELKQQKNIMKIIRKFHFSSKF